MTSSQISRLFSVVAISLLLSSVLVACAPLTSSPSREAAVENASDSFIPLRSGCSDAANWMKCMFPQGNVALTEMYLPGSHDSATWNIPRAVSQAQTVELGSYREAFHCPVTLNFVVPLTVTAKWAITQTSSTTEQAQAGVRYFDIRAYFDQKDDLKTCHSLVGATLGDAIGASDGFTSLVQNHPDEIFILDFNGIFAYDGQPKTPERMEKLARFLSVNYANLAFNPRVALGSSLDQVTIAEMRKTGRNVVILAPPELAEKSGQVWNRYGSTYSCWQDDSPAAQGLWRDPQNHSYMATVAMTGYMDRELDCLDKAPVDIRKLNILNFIADSGCPGGGNYCISEYVHREGTVAWAKHYFDPVLPVFSQRVLETGLPAIIMHDLAHLSNRYIWDLNFAKKGS